MTTSFAVMLDYPRSVVASSVSEDELGDYEECIICKRPFGHAGDTTDLNEESEKAVCLQPCGHIVGGECIQNWCRRNPTSCLCPYCRVDLRMKNTSPFWILPLSYLTSTWWFDSLDTIASHPAWSIEAARQSALNRTLKLGEVVQILEVGVFVCMLLWGAVLAPINFVIYCITWLSGWGIPAILGQILFYVTLTTVVSYGGVCAVVLAVIWLESIAREGGR